MFVDHSELGTFHSMLDVLVKLDRLSPAQLASLETRLTKERNALRLRQYEGEENIVAGLNMLAAMVASFARDQQSTAKAMRQHWGPRCEEFEPDCCVCQAWRSYDRARAERLSSY